LHLVRPVALLRQVDDLGVVRLAQQLGEPLDLERLCFTALELDHRLSQLVGAHGLVTATQARQRLFEQTERLTQREATASTPCGSPAAPAFVAPSPPPPSSPHRPPRPPLPRRGPRRPPRARPAPPPRAAPAAPALLPPPPPPSSSPRRLARLLLARLGPRRPPRLGGGPGHAGTQRDLVLAVVELGEMDQALVGRFDHELREAREPDVLLVERRVDLLHHLLQAVGAHHVVVRRHLFHRLDHQLP